MNLKSIMNKKLEIINIDELKYYKYNERIREISDDQFQQLCENMLKYGWLDTLVINQDNVVLGGNQRLRAVNHLLSQGNNTFLSVPCYRIETKSEEEEARIVLILNNHHGKYNYDELAGFIKDFEIEIPELPDLGFDLPELESQLPNFDELFSSEKENKIYQPKDNEKEIDENNINTSQECPKCGYRW